MPLFCVQSLFNMAGWWYTYPSEKYEFVKWDDDIPNIWKNKTYSKPPVRLGRFELRNQPCSIHHFFLRKLKPKKPGPQSEPIKMIRRRATHGKPTTKQETGTIYQREALHLSAVLWERVYHWSCCCRGTFWTLNLAQRIETQYRKTTTTTTKTEKSSGTMSLFYLFGLHIYFLARYNGFPLKHCQCVNGETVPSNHGKCWPAGPSKFAHSFPCFCTSFICRTS